MASFSDYSENKVLNYLLRGKAFAVPNLYLALFTSSNGLEANTHLTQTEVATSGTGYARVAIPVSTGWTDNGSSFANAALLQFGQCTAGSNTVTHFAICTAITAGQLIVSGALNSSLNISSGIQPQFASGSLSVSSD